MMVDKKRERMTTSSGSPVDDDQNSMTVGPRGPVLMQDIHLVDKLAHFNRERIPERIVHAKGAGAFGYFEVKNDLSGYTRAKFLSEVGKRTDVVARFSTVGGEKGSADAERDPRGFAVKFYTEEGNYDFVGNNTPVFFIRDPLKFPDFIHTQKRNPVTNTKDPDMFWDFLSLTPESVHQVTILFSDRGTPKSFRHMNGYSGHTFMWYNEEGEQFWVKTHFVTAQGIQNLTRDEATRMKGVDPDHATRDLFDAIARGEHPAWNVSVQIMKPEDAEKYRFNPFDITKVWPHGDYPLIPLGRMVLNRNPENYFTDVEQAAFSPANLVPGIAPSPDKMLQGRLFAYNDAHRYRLGANYEQLPVNQPKGKTANYQRDGFMRLKTQFDGAPNYYPNTFNGPEPDPSVKWPEEALSGHAGRHAYPPADDYIQPGVLYRKVMTDVDRDHLIGNIVDHLSHAKKGIQQLQAAVFYRVDPEYGERVAAGLGLDVKAVRKMAEK
jgi:catalase